MSKFNKHAIFEVEQSFKGGIKWWEAEFNSLAELRHYGRRWSAQYQGCRVLIREIDHPENYWCWNRLY